MRLDLKTEPGTVIAAPSGLMDYIELMKPELTMLSVLSCLCGYYLATSGAFDIWRFVHTAIGTLLLGGGAGALNQYIEREYDALMKRTERRPLPAKRLNPEEVRIFGIILTAAGLLELYVFTTPLASFLGAVTFGTYIFLYTPLKRVSPLSTIVGAIPGALPPMIGWAAVRNAITADSWILFGILFCWQVPHFLSLAWMYRKDYARAGFKMLTVVDPDGRKTSRQILYFTVSLIPASLLGTFLGLTGTASTVAALALGAMFLWLVVAFLRSAYDSAESSSVRHNVCARRIFFASLLYLPILMTVMSIDKV